MLALFAVTIPILLTDIVNPVLMAGVIYTLGSRKPYLNSVLILLGWFVIYFICGIALALGLEAVTHFLDNPRPADFYIETVVSVLLLWLAIHMLRKKEGKRKKKDFGEADTVSPVSAFMIGASINLIGMPFAIPYFAVIDQMLKADLSWTGGVLVLFVYNLLYILPFGVLIIIRHLSREKSEIIFSKISGWMDRVSAVLIPVMMIIIALIFLTDAVVYFTTGRIIL